MIKQGDYYYVFYTGGFINAIRSKDLLHWESPAATPTTGTAPTPAPTGRGGRGGGRGPRPASVFPGMPNSASAILPSVNSLWAPDIALFKGRYLMYYAASSFGSRNSVIGLATNKTLDPASKDYQWHDDGIVVQSQNSDNYNAIDPNFVLDEKGRPWLTFGSFWTGIKLLQLGDDGKPDPAHKTLYSIAARAPGSTAIEAPFIIHEDKYFYLFVSWDTCCRGLSSTYRIMVGRSEKITGPYLDKTGADMAKGGGTQLLAGDAQRYIGPGGQSLLKDADRWLLVYHFYDGNTPNGTSRLQIRPLSFDNQAWPTLNKPLNSPN